MEAELAHLEFEITRERATHHAFLTVDQIEAYLRQFVFENPSDVQVRKLLVNTFIREVLLYDDSIVITYNFSDDSTRPKVTKEQAEREERQIEQAKHIVSPALSSSISSCSPPKREKNPLAGFFFVWRHGVRTPAMCRAGIELYLFLCYNVIT